MCMLKKSIQLIILLFSIQFLNANGFTNWLQHCNFYAGFNFPIKAYVDIPESSESIYLRDRFGDKYYFSYDYNDAKGIAIPIMMGMKIPFWFNEFHSIGFQIDANFITTKIAQGHGDLYYSFAPIKRFQFTVFGGFSIVGFDLSMGKLQPAFPGDPGYYNSEGKFVKPGTEMKLQAIGYKGFNIGTSVKYKPFKYDKLFFLLGLRYSSDIVIDNFKIKFDNKEVDKSNLNFDKIKIGSAFHIFLSFGWGI